MKWLNKKCSPADMIRIQEGGIYHYGIYISDDEIIQFGLPPDRLGKVSDEKIKVVSSDRKTFCREKTIEVAEYDETENGLKNSLQKTIENARHSIGSGGYNLVRNNCKHFAYRCVFDDRVLTPEDQLRQMWKNRPQLDVYVSKIPSDIHFEEVFPETRKKEIFECADGSLKKQKYWAWKTLEYGALRSFGISMEKLAPTKNEKGKWTGEKYFFSISHIQNTVAVALSTSEVGIDIENVDEFEKRFAGKEKRLNEVLGTNGSFDLKKLAELWTKKEARFKSLDSQQNFVPAKILFDEKNMFTKFDDADFGRHCISVCSAIKDKIRFYTYSPENTKEIAL